MAFKGGDSRSTLAEINVTPLVDVMLVLLIIFMVAAPMLTTGVEVELPKAKASRIEMNSETLLLSIDSKHRVFLGEDEIPAAKLAETLVSNSQLANESVLYIRADRNVPYGFVAAVFSLVKEAGVKKVGLVTDSAARNTLDAMLDASAIVEGATVEGAVKQPIVGNSAAEAAGRAK